MQTLLAYAEDDLTFELSTILATEKPQHSSSLVQADDMLKDYPRPFVEMLQKSIEDHKPHLDIKKIQHLLTQRLQPMGYNVKYHQVNELIEFLDIKKQADEDQYDDQDDDKSQTEYALHPVSGTDYCFHLHSSDTEQDQTTFQENYQLYATMLEHVVNSVYESEGKLPPTKTYEIKPQRNIDGIMQRMNNRIALQKSAIRSAGINIFGEETTDTDEIEKIKPENMKNITFDDIGGHEEVKKLLRLGVLGLTQPEKFTQQGAIPPTKFLLNGPTGTGKSSLAIATAREAGVPTYSMQVGNILRSLVGASEQRVRDTFAQARKDGKAVIILDELDAIARSRESYMHGITTTLMTELDGIADNTNILVIGTTNLREIIDPGMLRAGRFNHIIDVKLPEPKEREKIFAIHMQAAERRAQRKLFNPQDIELLTEDTAGLSGADIEEIVKRVVNQRVMEKEFLEIEPPEYETTERILKKIEEYDPVRKGKGDVGFPIPHKIKSLSN